MQFSLLLLFGNRLVLLKASSYCQLILQQYPCCRHPPNSGEVCCHVIVILDEELEHCHSPLSSYSRLLIPNINMVASVWHRPLHSFVLCPLFLHWRQVMCDLSLPHLAPVQPAVVSVSHCISTNRGFDFLGTHGSSFPRLESRESWFFGQNSLVASQTHPPLSPFFVRRS